MLLFHIFFDVLLMIYLTVNHFGSELAALLHPKRASCTVPRLRDQPGSAAWLLAASETLFWGGSLGADPLFSVAKDAAALWEVIVSGSSSMGVSWDPPIMDEELDNGGTVAEMELGAGLHSPEGVCFLRRNVSIQLELCFDPKEPKTREERRMFFPDVMSSPKPS